jgi:DNA-binding LacI/PurR family transcriptional regulator
VHSVIQHHIKGITDKLLRYGLQLPKENRIMLESAIDPASADKTVQALAKLKPSISAAFVTSDQNAASIISGLTKLNIRVPEDISIVGFDNIQISVQTSHQLTTIVQDLGEKAALSVDILNHRMQNPNVSAESHVN